MFNSTFGAGFRAGKSEPGVKLNSDGTKHLVWTECPFPLHQLIRHFLWQSGYQEGLHQKILQPTKRKR